MIRMSIVSSSNVSCTDCYKLPSAIGNKGHMMLDWLEGMFLLFPCRWWRAEPIVFGVRCWSISERRWSRLLGLSFQYWGSLVVRIRLMRWDWILVDSLQVRAGMCVCVGGGGGGGGKSNWCDGVGQFTGEGWDVCVGGGGGQIQLMWWGWTVYRWARASWGGGCLCVGGVLYNVCMYVVCERVLTLHAWNTCACVYPPFTSSLPAHPFTSSLPPHPPPASSSTNTAYSKLQNCQGLMTEQLTKAWDDYLIGERSHYQPIQESMSRGTEPRKSFLTLRRRKERERARSTNLEGTVQVSH